MHRNGFSVRRKRSEFVLVCVVPDGVFVYGIQYTLPLPQQFRKGEDYYRMGIISIKIRGLFVRENAVCRIHSVCLFES